MHVQIRAQVLAYSDVPNSLRFRDLNSNKRNLTIVKYRCNMSSPKHIGYDYARNKLNRVIKYSICYLLLELIFLSLSSSYDNYDYIIMIKGEVCTLYSLTRDQ